ncbi:SpoIIE family protein phosphatase [Aliifodinibius sp. S!AR15-10]|uniref:SpoIIE family protein phosphatase n=1 Tax=Aliifodinibius sp. S!AR15-10 TaxID=2950437 RepID=UPI00286FED0A|nr:SpoIIE family protein phosphatase [Aliifodinibius sp. S!AR15-10]
MSFDRIEMESGQLSFGEWWSAKSPKRDEAVCGDQALIRQIGNQILFGVVDGLGHGIRAAEASTQAMELLQTFKEGESIISLLKRCHKHLRYTRGVVLSLGVIDSEEDTLTWTGVGNVEGILLRPGKEKLNYLEAITLRAGVVGYKLPSPRASIVPVSIGDLIVFTTDGVESSYLGYFENHIDAEETVGKIAGNCFKQTDDALLFIFRYN